MAVYDGENPEVSVEVFAPAPVLFCSVITTTHTHYKARLAGAASTPRHDIVAGRLWRFPQINAAKSIARIKAPHLRSRYLASLVLLLCEDRPG